MSRAACRPLISPYHHTPRWTRHDRITFPERPGVHNAKERNKVILVGNVGKDPEVKYTPSGIPVGKFSLATNERFKDKNGEFQERTEWHNIVVWQRLAEILGEFVSKGSKVYVEGKLQTTSWEDRQSPSGNTGPRWSRAISCFSTLEGTSKRRGGNRSCFR